MEVFNGLVSGLLFIGMSFSIGYLMDYMERKYMFQQTLSGEWEFRQYRTSE